MVADGERLRIEQLFNTSWYRRDEKDRFRMRSLGLVLYAPLGFIIFLARLGILLQFFLLKQMLPESNFKRSSLRVMGIILGVTVSTEGEISATTFVSNHITILDHFVIHVMTNGFLFTEEKRMGNYVHRLLGITEDASITSLIHLPEGETTNGVRGLLSFSEMTPTTENLIQPIALQVERPFLNVNSIYAGFKTELFITLFLPNTHYTLRFLSPESWEGLKIQKSIATSLAILPTKFVKGDKTELLKRLNYRPPSVTSMARLVQQQLHPIVLSPESVISAIQKTGSVEGALNELRNSIAQPSFHKNSSERMMSFQERKRIMIQLAREKYAEKNGLSMD